jgi:excisionase family DNA binding protein
MNENQTAITGAGQQIAPDYYEDKKQLAKRIQCSVRTIDNLMARGLPHVKLTRKLTRFPRVAVDEWIATRQIRRS